MAMINFESVGWIGLTGSFFSGIELTDPDVSVTFIIIGTCWIQEHSGQGHVLGFSRQDSPSAFGRLIIQFPTPQATVRIQLMINGSFDGPTSVTFHANTGASGNPTISSQQFADWAFNQFVEYNDPANLIREVRISTFAEEAYVDNIEFFEEAQAVQHRLALALDGSGSMAEQNKWEAMIEAADIFHDLYHTMATPTDTFGAVRFRWRCNNAAGNLIVNQPPSSPLSTAADIPALYAADAPAECTPIGEGLIAAANMVTSSGPGRHILLLTDGINNRGRTVAEASLDSALNGVTVHTIGLGTMANINPVEIAQVAADHSGTYLQTTQPSQILDFFVQALGQMLGKAELVILTGAAGDTATIHAGSQKAVLLIAWDNPAVANDFDLVAPDGSTIDHTAVVSPTGAIVTYFPASPSSAHAFYVVEGDLAGDWVFSNVPAGVRMLAVEDLSLRIAWSVNPVVGCAGNTLRLTARITENGRPYKGKAKVTVAVRRPAEAQGDLLAKEMQRKPLDAQKRGDLSVRQQIVTSILGRLGKEDFLFASASGRVLKKTGGGVYALDFADTEFDGVYTFNFEAVGGQGRTRFRRRCTLCAVLTGAPDTGSTDVQMRPVSKGAYQVTVTPRAKNGAHLGPFLAIAIRMQVSNGRKVGPPVDLLNGSYSQLVVSTDAQPPVVGLEVAGHHVGLKAGEILPPKSRGKHRGRADKKRGRRPVR